MRSALTAEATSLSASISNPESISSKIESLGFNANSCTISLRFFSPPENPAFKSLLSKSTLYVNLEPCCHHGKTPPCTDLIIRHNFSKVVIGCIDPFSEVSGRGIKKLEDNSIKVVHGVLEEKCKDLNRRFFNFHKYNP